MLVRVGEALSAAEAAVLDMGHLVDVARVVDCSGLGGLNDTCRHPRGSL